MQLIRQLFFDQIPSIGDDEKKEKRSIKRAIKEAVEILKFACNDMLIDAKIMEKKTLIKKALVTIIVISGSMLGMYIMQSYFSICPPFGCFFGSVG